MKVSPGVIRKPHLCSGEKLPSTTPGWHSRIKPAIFSFRKGLEGLRILSQGIFRNTLYAGVTQENLSQVIYQIFSLIN